MAELQIHANLATAVGAVFIPVCSACVALRLYARRLHGVNLGADDWTIISALVFVIAMGITIIIEVKRKQLAYPASKEPGKPTANIAFWPVEILQVPALGLVKSSFILLYRRVFTKRTAPVFNMISWLVLAVVVSWALAFFFSLVFMCGTDFSAYWTSTEVEKARCVDTNALHNAFAISDFLTDLLIVLLPLPMIWQLHLTTRRKLGLCAIFGLGALTVGASIVRMVVFLQATSVQFNPDADFEFVCTAGLYWSMIESGLGLCAACLPVQYGLMRSKGVRSIVRSVQSAFSLHSRPSPKNSAQRSKLSPQHSQECIITHVEGPAASDDHALEMGRMPQHREILVTQSLEQVEHHPS